MTSTPERRPSRWLRLLYRAPLVAYRAGLGGREHWIGMAWVMIETRGRRTGRARQVLVDLLGEDPAAGRFFVQSAYGSTSDWVRNAEAHGSLWAEVRGERFSARLEHAGEETAHRVMLAYVSAHPLYSPFIARMLGYRGPLRDREPVADWLVEHFGMLAIVRSEDPPARARAAPGGAPKQEA